MSSSEHRPIKTDIVLPSVGEFQPAAFEALIDQEFAVDLRYCDLAEDATPIAWEGYRSTEEECQLTLVECHREKQLTEHTREDPFTLLFRGPHEVPLPGRVHVVENSATGRFCLLLTPINVAPGIAPEAHPEGRFYESVIG